MIADGLCRDCLTLEPGPGPCCQICGSRRLLRHPELATLSIAHIDCDAFYASVEKRDRPELHDKPVIVGGGRRGVVSAACYTARLYGVRSAMPMFKALALCPDAVVIKPDISKYSGVGRHIRAIMQDVTPLVEPLSIDEAFLDLTGTEMLHGGPPARTLAALAKRVEKDEGLTVSVGLSYNKSLAKIASDLDKPQGFSVLGRGDAQDFLAGQPVSLIWGVGKALKGQLEQAGIRKIGDLLDYEEAGLILRFGSIGKGLYRFARGEDERRVTSNAEVKSISAETTFNLDLSSLESLEAELWPLCEKVSRRLKRAQLAGHAAVLKLKTARFSLITRQRRLDDPTQLASRLFKAAQSLLTREVDGRSFRLIGIGCDDLCPAKFADPPSLLEPDRKRKVAVEAVMDRLRDKLGDGAIQLGRGFKTQQPNCPKSG
ncbi:MAG: DNA polymerase IV [Rhodospirillales bacterium]|nr:DNA polymerase IV [Rhodospirillales bacterium]